MDMVDATVTTNVIPVLLLVDVAIASVTAVMVAVNNKTTEVAAVTVENAVTPETAM